MAEKRQRERSGGAEGMGGGGGKWRPGWARHLQSHCAEAPQMGSQRADVGPWKRQKANTTFAYPELRGVKKEVWLGNAGCTGNTLRELNIILKSEPMGQQADLIKDI